VGVGSKEGWVVVSITGGVRDTLGGGGGVSKGGGVIGCSGEGRIEGGGIEGGGIEGVGVVGVIEGGGIGGGDSVFFSFSSSSSLSYSYDKMISLSNFIG
jgi:hypothetical protein